MEAADLLAKATHWHHQWSHLPSSRRRWDEALEPFDDDLVIAAIRLTRRYDLAREVAAYGVGHPNLPLPTAAQRAAEEMMNALTRRPSFWRRRK